MRPSVGTPELRRLGTASSRSPGRRGSNAYRGTTVRRSQRGWPHGDYRHFLIRRDNENLGRIPRRGHADRPAARRFPDSSGDRGGDNIGVVTASDAERRIALTSARPRAVQPNHTQVHLLGRANQHHGASSITVRQALSSPTSRSGRSAATEQRDSTAPRHERMLLTATSTSRAQAGQHGCSLSNFLLGGADWRSRERTTMRHAR
jgi:hypothetical protein